MDKTQKRQLETNDLSEKVLSFFDKIQPYLIPILLAALLLTVFYLSFTLYNSWNTGKTAKVCEKIFQNVNNPAELEEYAQQVNQPLKSWALNLAGNARLSEAITNVPNNRAAAEEALAKAEEDFNTASNSPNDDAQQLACFGLARVYEQKAATTATDSAKNIANSIKYYKSLTTKWPSSIYAKQAQMRIAALSNETTVKILSDYATYEKTEPPAGERNDIPLDINAPVEEQPAATEEAKPAEEQPAAEEAKPAEEQPAAEEAKPAEEQPAAIEEAKPAEEQPAPAEEAKPAEEQPATEEAKPAEEQPAPAEEAKPAEEQPAAEEAKPAEEQPAPAEEAKPAEEQPTPAEEAKPAEEKPAPAEEAKPAEEQPAPAEEAKPAEEQPAPAEEAKPAEEQPAATEEAKPAEEQPAPAEEAKPAEEKPAPAEEAKPAEEKPAPAEEAKPAEEKPAAEEAK